jgi:hypothetical protein
LHTDHTDIKNTRSQIKQSIHDEIAQSLINPDAQVNPHRLFMLLHGKRKIGKFKKPQSVGMRKSVED